MANEAVAPAGDRAVGVVAVAVDVGEAAGADRAVDQAAGGKADQALMR